MPGLIRELVLKWRCTWQCLGRSACYPYKLPLKPYKLVYAILASGRCTQPNLLNGPSFKAQGRERARDTEYSIERLLPGLLSCFFVLAFSYSSSPREGGEGSGLGWVRVTLEYHRCCQGGEGRTLGALWVRPSPPLHGSYAAICSPSFSGVTRPVKMRHRSMANCLAMATMAFFFTARVTFAFLSKTLFHRCRRT